MNINTYIAKQFADPKGLGGSLVSFAMNRQNRPLYDETIRFLATSDSDSILDIGCGNGYVLKLLARQSNASFVGIDISTDIIKAASQRNRKHKKMRFSCQNVSSMSFPDQCFSKAYTINTVYFWEDLSKTLLEIQRVLKPNGFFINTLYTNETLARFSHTQFGYKRYEPEDLIRTGESTGFLVEARPILRGTAICYMYTKA